MMTPKKHKCIYCDLNFTSGRSAEGDHIISAQLGDFEDARNFYNICPKCNSEIGKFEEQMLFCSQVAIFRDIVKPSVKKKRKRGSSKRSNVRGTPTPRHTINQQDHNVMVEADPEDPLKVSTIDQLVVVDKKGSKHYIRLFSGMKAEDIKSRLAKLELTSFDRIYLHCKTEELKQYFNEILSKVLEGSTYVDLSTITIEEGPIDGTIELKVTNHYFRALAKIAFHYYLVYSKRSVKGDEPEFQKIRSFIKNGGNIAPFFNSPDKNIISRLRAIGDQTITLGNPCHILAARETEGTILVFMQLCVKPGMVFPSYYVTLGKMPGRIIVPNYCWGHVYLYNEKQEEGKKAGKVIELSVEKIYATPV